MPDEPNRNLDEQLSAWARKRRDEAGAPFELHPATRKLLQDEIARTLPKKSDAPASEPAGWWKMFWPRFAFAGSLCLAMGILAGLLLPSLAKSKSKAQQIALLRQQEKLRSADSEPRDAPAEIVPNSSVAHAVEPPARHLGDEAGKSAVVESQPPAAPPLAVNKPSEPEVKFKAELKDVRLKAGQPATAEERLLSEKSRQSILSDKAKEPTPAGTAAPARELYAEKEQTLPRQRYALSPAPAAPAIPPGAAPQVALDGANVGQRADSLGGRGFAGGTVSNSAPGVNLAFNRPQSGAKADTRSLALTPPSRVATGH